MFLKIEMSKRTRFFQAFTWMWQWYVDSNIPVWPQFSRMWGPLSTPLQNWEKRRKIVLYLLSNIYLSFVSFRGKNQWSLSVILLFDLVLFEYRVAKPTVPGIEPILNHTNCNMQACSQPFVSYYKSSCTRYWLMLSVNH